MTRNDRDGATAVWTKHAREGEVSHLEREVAVLAELDGAGVVELEGSGDGWFTTRVAGRRTLAELAAGGGIDSDVAIAALASLDELHHAGWCHGAASLDHAVVAANGRVRWCSLGHARRLDGPRDPAARRERAAVEDLLSATPHRDGRKRPTRARRRAVSPPPPVVARRRRRSRRALLATCGFGAVACGAYVTFTALAGSDTPLERAARLAALTTGALALYGTVANAVLGIAWANKRVHLAQRVAGAVPRWLAWCVVGSAGVTAATTAVGAVAPGPGSVAVTAPTPRSTATTTVDPNPTVTATSTTVPTPETTVPAVPPSTPAPSPVAEPPTPPVDEAVARRGDHLWGIAEDALARHLQRPPSPGEVARYWRQLVEANRSRLVDPSNPDLIYAGQRFVLPPP